MRKLIKRPPPIVWFLERRIFLYFGPKLDFKNLIKYSFKQFYWWFFRPFYLIYKKEYEGINFFLFLLACIINPFKPSEIRFWQALGITSWKEISLISPELLLPFIHDKKRKIWPGQSKKAIFILNDKASLYEITPKNLIPDYLLYPNIFLNDYTKLKWWKEALQKEGIILKPSCGSGGKDIKVYKLIKNFLYERDLLSNRFIKLKKSNLENISPSDLYVIWRSDKNIKSKVIMMPYFKSKLKIPELGNSIVFRVITKQDSLFSKVSIATGWIEILIDKNNFGFISIEGKLFINNKKNKKLSNYALKCRNYIYPNLPKELKKCLYLSKRIHKILPPINSIAWDWIPSGKKPILLEGNSYYSLTIPQMFEKLNQK